MDGEGSVEEEREVEKERVGGRKRERTEMERNLGH